MKQSKDLARIEKQSRRQFETENDRFERGYRGRTALCILLATAIHFGFFAANPRLQIADIDVAADQLFATTLPPDVRIPPPPQAVARPARPRVSAAAAAEEITIAPTTFESNPVEGLSPPPPVATTQKNQNEPFYVPHDIEPRLLNGAEVLSLLQKEYPRTLCEAGIQGKVLLWVFVERDGAPASCRVHTSSGYPGLDEAAKNVVSHMEFAPAMHMDKPVAVWIAQPVEFTL